VNVTNYSVDEFRKKVADGDHFLTSVLKSSLQFVKGEQRDLDAIAGNCLPDYFWCVWMASIVPTLSPQWECVRVSKR